MKNNLYVDVHVLQTVPPSCVNRDDTGSPKTAVYGGTNRARVSSQAWKRAMRMMFKEMLEADKIGFRTRNVKQLLINKLFELAPDKREEDIAKIAEIALEASKIKSGGDKKDVLFFISSVQLEALAKVALEYDEDDSAKKEKEQKFKKRWQEALNGKPSVDMLLFGRMAASDPELNCEASAQVAHCISTHEVSNEFDYFTAVDDYDEDGAGAGHIGTVEFNSSTLYRYATVNVGELYQSSLSTDEVADAVKGFVEAFIKSMPEGKQNSFANRTLPFYTYVTIREDQPINMVGAFEKAVAKTREGYGSNSIKALEDFMEKVYGSFAEKPKKSWVVSIENTAVDAKRVKMSELLAEVSAEVSTFE